MASDTAMVSESAGEIRALTRLRCWGDFAVSDSSTGEDLRPRGRKARALLAYLALHPGRAVSRERLTGLLWGDRAEEQARASLRQSIFELKAFTHPPRQLMSVDRDHLTLDPAALLTDIGELRAAARDGAFAAIIDAIPEPDERLFADLDGLDSGFDDWLAIERAHQREALNALIGDAAKAAAANADARHARLLTARLRELGGEVDNLRLVSPVVPPESAADASEPARRRGLDRWRVALLAALILVAAVIAIGGWQYRWSGSNEPIPIAVLPFEEMSGDGDAYFAEGVSEEILGRLARNPRFKVMGRTSAWSFQGQPLDAPTLGRRLAVAYLVEGSVRRAGERVRVNVALVRASDGIQIWAERYDARLDDILAIQDRIGIAVSARLDGGPTAPATTIATRGDVYGLYLTARGLIRDREPAKLDAAVDLLRRAVALDPGFAPAWASLGSALQMRWGAKGDRANEVAVRAEALDHVDRALRLQPDLAQAHAARAMIFNFRGQEARASIERAVQLDPNSAENWYWMAMVRVGAGDYPGALAALRRSVAIDPLWHRAFAYASRWAWAMGYREEAIAYLRRAERDGTPLPFQAYMVRSELAEHRGDLSSAAQLSKAAIDVADEGRRRFAFGLHARMIWALGDPREAQQVAPLPSEPLALWMGRPPAPGILDSRYAARQAGYVDAPRSWDDSDYIVLAMRLLLNADRSAEVAALYDRRLGSPDAMAREAFDHVAFIEETPLVALALQATGRDREADALIGLADREVRARLRGGAVPAWYHVACARIWAIGGDRAAALSALERAVSLGWIPIEPPIFRDLARQPGFGALRGDPRFERVRARLRAHIERERRELGPIAI